MVWAFAPVAEQTVKIETIVQSILRIIRSSMIGLIGPILVLSICSRHPPALGFSTITTPAASCCRSSVSFLGYRKRGDGDAVEPRDTVTPGPKRDAARPGQRFVKRCKYPTPVKRDHEFVVLRQHRQRVPVVRGNVRIDAYDLL